MNPSSVTGTFTGATASAGAIIKQSEDPRPYPFNVSLWGTFVATVILERSFDGGATYLPLTALGSPIGTFSGPISEVWEEHEPNVKYRLRCSAFTSGTVNYRLSS
jgi:hypothetical protein